MQCCLGIPLWTKHNQWYIQHWFDKNELSVAKGHKELCPVITLTLWRWPPGTGRGTPQTHWPQLLHCMAKLNRLPVATLTLYLNRYHLTHEATHLLRLVVSISCSKFRNTRRSKVIVLVLGAGESRTRRGKLKNDLHIVPSLPCSLQWLWNWPSILPNWNTRHRVQQAVSAGSIQIRTFLTCYANCSNSCYKQ